MVTLRDIRSSGHIVEILVTFDSCDLRLSGASPWGVSRLVVATGPLASMIRVRHAHEYVTRGPYAPLSHRGPELPLSDYDAANRCKVMCFDTGVAW